VTWAWKWQEASEMGVTQNGNSDIREQLNAVSTVEESATCIEERKDYR